MVGDFVMMTPRRIATGIGRAKNGWTYIGEFVMSIDSGRTESKSGDTFFSFRDMRSRTLNNESIEGVITCVYLIIEADNFAGLRLIFVRIRMMKCVVKRLFRRSQVGSVSMASVRGLQVKLVSESCSNCYK